MNEVIEKESIGAMIYEIRGKQVMLDSDLAKLYQCTNGTKDINKAVNRNIEKFPNDFYFRLTEKEVNSISRFQTGTLNGRGSNIKYLPHVFTEQGVAMLATILHTKVATQVSIKIMDAFIEMRHYLNANQDIYKSISHINNNFHDRFIIIDRKILYHLGASFKDLGVKCFGINRIEDKKYLSMLLEEISIYE